MLRLCKPREGKVIHISEMAIGDIGIISSWIYSFNNNYVGQIVVRVYGDQLVSLSTPNVAWINISTALHNKPEIKIMLLTKDTRFKLI